MSPPEVQPVRMLADYHQNPSKRYMYVMCCMSLTCCLIIFCVAGMILCVMSLARPLRNKMVAPPPELAHSRILPAVERHLP